jgi:hypothetical protein
MVNDEKDFLEDMADIDLTAPIPSEWNPEEDDSDFTPQDENEDANG